MKKNTSKYKYWLKRGVPAVLIPGLIFATLYGVDNLKNLKKYQEDEKIFPKSGEVMSVEDGDTFKLASGQTIRLIGIDAPNRGEEGEVESKKTLEELVLNEKVWLEYDRYQDDKYGRVLAWVWIKCNSEKPEFKPADYMHLNGKESRDYLTENPVGCNKGELVNKRLVKDNKAKIMEYEKRGRLKYRL